MANTYSAGGSRQAVVLVAIIVLHIGFFWALKQGLVRGAVQLIQDFSIMDLPPPPPPPEDLDEPPPPPPVDVLPPVVPPPLIDLPVFEGPSTAITARVVEPPPRATQPQAPPRQVQITPARIKARSDRIAAAINACYPSASRRLSEEGRVMLTITISAGGKVGAMSVNQSSGFARLDGAAECVVRRLPFEPGKRDGQPVDSQATLPIVFKLE
jgi:protein TonB